MGLSYWSLLYCSPRPRLSALVTKGTSRESFSSSGSGGAPRCFGGSTTSTTTLVQTPSPRAAKRSVGAHGKDKDHKTVESCTARSSRGAVTSTRGKSVVSSSVEGPKAVIVDRLTFSRSTPSAASKTRRTYSSLCSRAGTPPCGGASGGLEPCNVSCCQRTWPVLTSTAMTFRSLSPYISPHCAFSCGASGDVSGKKASRRHCISGTSRSANSTASTNLRSRPFSSTKYTRPSQTLGTKFPEGLASGPPDAKRPTSRPDHASSVTISPFSRLTSSRGCRGAVFSSADC
mmetsp:Transcript_9968/g.30241  ORF Transcript_9968/g.30241 Transcript_9968/m.30241 type:complete len:288 (+) Transcript_9968:764-1627(+)